MKFKDMPYERISVESIKEAMFSPCAALPRFVTPLIRRISFTMRKKTIGTMPILRFRNLIRNGLRPF